MRAASASDSSPFRKAATSSGEGGPPRRSRSAAMKSLAAAFQSAFVFIVDYLFPVDVAPFGADDRLQLVARVAEARADRLVREAGRRGDLLGGRAAQAEEEAEARRFGERGQSLPEACAEECRLLLLNEALFGRIGFIPNVADHFQRRRLLLVPALRLFVAPTVPREVRRGGQEVPPARFALVAVDAAQHVHERLRS